MQAVKSAVFVWTGWYRWQRLPTWTNGQPHKLFHDHLKTPTHFKILNAMRTCSYTPSQLWSGIITSKILIPYWILGGPTS